MDFKKGSYCSTGIIALLIALSLALTSCGSGTVADSPSDGSSFFAANLPGCASPPENSVSLCKNNDMSSGDIIAVDVRLNSSAPVYGAAFDLQLDQSVEFLPPEPPPEGSKLWKHLFVAQNDEGLIVGASRGKELGPLTGDINVVTLKFRRPAIESPVNFFHNSIVDEKGLPLDIEEDKWYGGYFKMK